jgi:hypothetical protein
MDRFNEFMTVYRAPEGLRDAVRSFVIHCRAIKRELSYRGALDELSPHLRGALGVCPSSRMPGGGRAHGGVTSCECGCTRSHTGRGVGRCLEPYLFVGELLASLPPSLLCLEMRGGGGVRAAVCAAHHCYGPAIAAVPFFYLKLGGVRDAERAEAEQEGRLFVQQVWRRPLRCTVAPFLPLCLRGYLCSPPPSPTSRHPPTVP